MSITFGSFGDIIAAVEIAYKLLVILNDHRGVQEEFLDLVQALRAFHRLLDYLVIWWQTREPSTTLDNLFDVLHPTIYEAKGEISTFLDKILSRYGKSLVAGSKYNPVDAAKRLQWHVFERSEVSKLQGKLAEGQRVIIMVQGQANLISEEQNATLVRKRLAALMEKENEIKATLDQRFDQIEEKLEEQKNMLGVIYSGVGSIGSMLQPISYVSNMATRIYAELQGQRAMISNLNPHAETSAIIEDALGWKFSIPLDVIRSWTTLHSILLDRTRDRPEHGLIKSRRYILQSDMNDVDIRQDMPLHWVLQPGQTAKISMLYFSKEIEHTTVCLRCKKSTLIARDTKMVCLNKQCGWEIQRVEELTDSEYNQDESDKDHYTQHKGMLNDFEDAAPMDLVPDSATDISPEIFKRVRFISRWENRNDALGDLLFTTGQYSWWRTFGPEPEMMTKVYLKVLLKFANAFGDEMIGFDEHLNGQISINILTNILFVGTSPQNARPVILILAKDKKKRRRLAKNLAKLDWVAKNPYLFIATSTFGAFYPQITEIPITLYSEQNNQLVSRLAKEPYFEGSS